MKCHGCGSSVTEGQKFCQECGQSLRGVTDPTERLDHLAEPDEGAPPAGPGVGAGAEAEGVASEPTIPIDTTDGASESAAPAEPTGRGEELAAPVLADLPTQEINPREPLPDPMWAPTAENPVVEAAPDAAAATAAASPPTAPFDDLTTPTPADPMPAVGDETVVIEPASEFDDTPAALMMTGQLSDDQVDTDRLAGVGAATTVLPATGPSTTDEFPADEFPAVFDGSDDVQQFPPAREPFKLRLMFVLAFFGAIATLMAAVADVSDIRTSAPVDGITIGITTLSDIGVNLPVAGFIGAAVMTIGGLLACYGFRWGAGVAGGGGLAVAGWAGLTIGLAEAPIAVAESITRTTTTQQFTLTVTRDLGYWLVISAGVLGLLVFAASLRLSGTGGRRSLNPWVAAVGAVSAVILAFGPLIPEGDATFSDNFRSPTALIDLPTAYFAGRIGQVALIAVAGVVGFLLVRTYGLGLVGGGISVALWMWLSSLLGLGEDLLRGDQPLGIAAGNFGARDTTPHGVTTVGMVLTITMLVIASALAIVQYRRDAAQY